MPEVQNPQPPVAGSTRSKRQRGSPVAWRGDLAEALSGASMDERRSDLISLAAPAAVPLPSPTQAEGLVHHTAFSLGARRGCAKEEAFRMRAVPVRYWLIGLVLLLGVPLATVSSLVFARFADPQRAAAERQLIETTRALAIATE